MTGPLNGGNSCSACTISLEHDVRVSPGFEIYLTAGDGALRRVQLKCYSRLAFDVLYVGTGRVPTVFSITG